MPQSNQNKVKNNIFKNLINRFKRSKSVSKVVTLALVIASIAGVAYFGYNVGDQAKQALAASFDSISPTSGPSAGGTSVSFTGVGLTDQANVIQTSAGYEHTCVLLSTGKVKCWGSNSYGEQGYGTYGSSTSPNLFSGPGPDVNLGGSATQISAGYYGTCALLSSGNVKCWGLNQDGQLGYGDTVERTSPGPNIDLGGGTATQIGVGGRHTCALLSTGNVKCWGRNYNGQLGYGDNTNRTTPGPNIDLGGVTATQISLNGERTCALLSTGNVKCWGQFTNADNSSRTTPSPDIDFGSPVLQFSISGQGFGCAILSTGNVKCWGLNQLGQLGYGDNTNRTTPGPNIDLGGVTATQVNTGGYSTCVLLSTGNVRCWGGNWYGQLGYGDTTNRSTPGPNINTGGTATQISITESHICTLFSTQRIKCWGRGGNGQLGNYGIASDRYNPESNPVSILGPLSATFDGLPATSVVYVNSTTITAVTPAHAAGLVNVTLTNGDGTVYILNNSYTYIPPRPIENADISSMVCSPNSITTNQTIICKITTNVNLNTLLGSVNIRIGASGTPTNCAVTGFGATLTCSSVAVGATAGTFASQYNASGSGSTYANGNNITVIQPSLTPIVGPVAGGTTVTFSGAFMDNITVIETSVGYYHTCALLSTGNVRCWGSNLYGQLGYGDTVDRTSPGPDIDLGGTVTKISAGGSHTCALLSTGNVRCWGYGQYGALGYGNTISIGDDETPAFVGDVNVGGTVTQISAGSNHTCALLSTGSIRCWGNNWAGQLGYGNTNYIGDNETPASAGDVNVGGTVTQISAGGSQTCVLLTTTNVRCWGYNFYGSLGYPSLVNFDYYGDDETPNSLGDVDLGGVSVSQISTSNDHTCVVLSTGNVRCWGNNNVGQLGYAGVGDYTNSNIDVGGSVTKVYTGETHTCALLAIGNVRCWGGGYGFDKSALGYGNSNYIGDDETPASAGDVSVGGSVIYMATGGESNCVVFVSGNIRCWGSNGSGQLGYGNTTSIGEFEVPSSIGSVQNLTNIQLAATFDGLAAISVTYVNRTTVTAVTPAHAAGIVNVILTNGDGSIINFNNGFTYQASGGGSGSCTVGSGSNTPGQTTIDLCVNSGTLTLYAGDSTKNNDTCTPANITAGTVVDTTISGQTTTSITCNTAENSIALSSVTVDSKRQSSTANIDDIIFEDLRGLATSDYTISASVSNFTDPNDSNKKIDLGSNPDSVNNESDQDKPQTSSDTNKIFGVLDASASTITPLRSAATIAYGTANYSKGSRITLIDNVTQATLLSTTAPVKPGRVAIDGVLFKLRIPSLISAGNFRGTIVETVI